MVEVYSEYNSNIMEQRENKGKNLEVLKKFSET